MGKVLDDDLDTPPLFLGGRAPIYPTKLVLKGVESGSTVIRYKVTVDGKAVSPELVSATDRQFAAGVMYVMPSWRFRPATRGGVPVESTVEQEFKFGRETGGSMKR